MKRFRKPELLELYQLGDTAPDGGGVIESPIARFAASVILETGDPEDEQPEGESPLENAKRQFRALAVPYDVPIYRPSWMNDTTHIQFSKGSVTFAEGAQIFFGHDWMSDGVPIGLITDVEETDAGPIITASISGTPKGEEIWTLMQDGVLKKVSVGVEISKWEVDEENQLLTYLEAEAFETSVVPRPAFKDADVISLNSKSTNQPRKAPSMTTQTEQRVEQLTKDLQALTASVEQTSRQVDTLAALGLQSAGASIEVPFVSHAEWIKAFVAKDEKAIQLAQAIQAFTRATTYAEREKAAEIFATDTSDLGDWLKAGWIGDAIRMAMGNRRLTNFFAQSALPAEGMSVEYGILVANTLAVAAQAAENQALTYGEISFDTATAPVVTYGGYTSMSKQEIQRSALQVVQKAFTGLSRAYAVTTETAVRTAVALPANSTPLVTTGTHFGGDVGTGMGDADNWIDFVADGAAYLDDTWGVAPEGIIVSDDVWKGLAKVRTGGTDGEFLVENGGGDVSIPGLRMSLFGLPVIRLGGNATEFVRLAHSEAIRTLESGNAPFQLGPDEDITTLTDSYSVYGYAAIAPEEKGLLVSPDLTV